MKTVEMMQDFNMRSWRRFFAHVAILLLAGMLLGCSAARLAYSNGETLSYWWLNSYIDFDADQKQWVRRDIDRLFAWHRRNQLPDYVRLLGRVQKRIATPLTEADLLRDEEEVRRRIQILIDQAIPDLAGLALSLHPEQILNIEKKFTSNNEKYRKEYLQGDVEQRQRFRFEKALKQAEYWFGSLSDEQKKVMRAASDARPLDNELVMEDRVLHQRALIAVLKKIQAERPGKDAVIAMLRDYARATMERSANPRHKAFFEESRRANLRMMATVINSTTPEQKEHFVSNLQHWIDDFNSLAR